MTGEGAVAAGFQATGRGAGGAARWRAEEGRGWACRPAAVGGGQRPRGSMPLVVGGGAAVSGGVRTMSGALRGKGLGLGEEETRDLE